MAIAGHMIYNNLMSSLLAIDLGGTNSRFGLADLNDSSGVFRREVLPAEWVRQEAKTTDNLAPIIVKGATAADPCPLCMQVINRFLGLLGSESGNQALKLYARGGLYMGGGVLLHMLGKISFQPFVEAFRTKGKMSGLLQSIPVFLITKKHINLHGAVLYAKRKIGHPLG